MEGPAGDNRVRTTSPRRAAGVDVIGLPMTTRLEIGVRVEARWIGSKKPDRAVHAGPKIMSAMPWAGR